MLCEADANERVLRICGKPAVRKMRAPNGHPDEAWVCEYHARLWAESIAWRKERDRELDAGRGAK